MMNKMDMVVPSRSLWCVREGSKQITMALISTMKVRQRRQLCLQNIGTHSIV